MSTAAGQVVVFISERPSGQSRRIRKVRAANLSRCARLAGRPARGGDVGGRCGLTERKHDVLARLLAITGWDAFSLDRGGVRFIGQVT
jgi:hypothetical protein